MEGNIGLYWEKWVEKILLVEKRLFLKILGKIVKDSGGLTEFSPVRIPGKRINDLPSSELRSVYDKQQSTRKSNNKQQTSDKVDSNFH